MIEEKLSQHTFTGHITSAWFSTNNLARGKAGFFSENQALRASDCAWFSKNNLAIRSPTTLSAWFDI